jgi:hypothetical protein
METMGDETTGKGQGEECLTLDVNRWQRDGTFASGVQKVGGLTWTWGNAITKEQTSSIGYEVCTLAGSAPWVCLYCTLTTTQTPIDYRVGLTTTRQRLGGLRWWFVCPLGLWPSI